MGLDIYCGSVSRYIAGDWLTIVQQAGQASGTTVEVVRADEPEDAVRDTAIIQSAVQKWVQGLLDALGVQGGWQDALDTPYATDKPDWDGYGAVVQLAAFDERPDLVPGGKVRKGLRRTTTVAVLPRDFGESEAVKAASQAPARYPALLAGAQWCLPIREAPAVFRAPTPNGTLLTMGRVDQLLAELNTLNARTMRLSPGDLEAARQAGPPGTGAPVDEVAPFGAAVLLALAEYAAIHEVPWIMDY